MEFTPEMFTARRLNLYLSARGYGRVEVDMLPEEAIRLLLRIEAVRRKTDRDEQLMYLALTDRDYRIAWDRRPENVELHVRPNGLTWRFEARTDEGVETIQTRMLKRRELLEALLQMADPEAFRQEFRAVAEVHAEHALEALEEWLSLDSWRALGKTIVPLTEEDLVPILNADDPDVRERAMSALGRLEPEEGDGIESDAA